MTILDTLTLLFGSAIAALGFTCAVVPVMTERVVSAVFTALWGG